MPSRFDADYGNPALDLDPLIDEVFAELKSNFMEMPRGVDFIDYHTFEKGYQTLKRATKAFTKVDASAVEAAYAEAPIALIVFRSILGLTPPEWAYLASEVTGTRITQGAARNIDREIRSAPLAPRTFGQTKAAERVRALIFAGVQSLQAGAGKPPASVLHRLDKADTRDGLRSLRPLADLGVPYPVLLYERFLSRPFASHRDAVSERVGEVVEAAVKDVLTAARISFRETKRAERIHGFD